MNFKRIFFLKNQQASNINFFFIDETSKLVQDMIPAGQKGTKLKKKLPSLINNFNKFLYEQFSLYYEFDVSFSNTTRVMNNGPSLKFNFIAF